MNDKELYITSSIQSTVEGRVTGLGLSGLGPNSGEFTAAIQPDQGNAILLRGGIIDDGNSPRGLENGVFAGFVTLLTIAYQCNLRLRIRYTNYAVGEDRIFDVSFPSRL